MAMRAPYAPAYAGGPGGGSGGGAGGPSRGPMSPPGMQPMGGPPQSAPAPSTAPPHKGTLAPGTRVQVGALAVVVVRYLAEGGFAHVYLVRSAQPLPLPAAAGAPPGAEYTHVLKRIAVPDKEALAIVRGEVEVHRALRSHPNIVHFIEASATSLPNGGYEVFILMEYCSGGGLIDLMNARLRTRLAEADVLRIFCDVGAGLSAMHHASPPLLHRDLKVENVLLAPSTRPGGATYKLCDFGSTTPILSRRAPRSADEVRRLEAELNRTTTLQYRAPEMVDVAQRRVIDEKADVWAMGVLLYKLCYYTTPFEENGGGPLAILNARYRFPSQPAYSDGVKALVASMLQELSASRPTIDEVLMRAHSLLGTPAPDSVAHYAKLAQSGKQMSELPTLTSSKGGVELGADAAARALASQQAKGRIVPAVPGGTSDLIDMAPSEEETRRAEEAEARRRAEGITPMRRGRPGKAPGASNGSPAPSPGPKPTSAARLPAQLTGPRADASIKVAPPSAGGFSDTFSPSSGFGDSFAPSAAGGPSPTPVAATHTAPQSAGLRLPPGSANELRTTPLNHSPALPGFGSNAPSPRGISPLPSPVAPPIRAAPSGSASSGAKPRPQDDEASSRFPSVAELDARYASPPAVERKEERAALPGISQRESVGAVASRFASGSSSSTASAPSTSKPTDFGASLTARWPPLAGATSPLATPSQARKRPSIEHRHSVSGTPGSRTVSAERKAPEGSMKAPTLPARKPMPQDWLTAELDQSAQASGESKTKTLAAPAVVPEKAAYRSPARYAAERLPDVAADAPAAPQKAAPAEESESSGDEGPEEVEFSPRRPVSMAVSPSYGNASRSGRTSPGRIKKPSWLVEASKPASSASLQAAVSPRQDMPKASPSAAERVPSPAPAALSPQPSSARSPQPAAATRVPAWDEDDEEMRAMPPPRLDGEYIHRAPSGTVGRLIDIGGSRQASYDESFSKATAKPAAGDATSPPAADAGISPFAPTVKRFADAATSPTLSSSEKEERRTAPVAPVPRKGTAESMVSRYENLTLTGAPRGDSSAAKSVARSRSASPAKLASRPASPAKPSTLDDEAEDFKARFPSVEVKTREPVSAPARAASPAKSSITDKAPRTRDFSPPRRATTLAASVPFAKDDDDESKPQARLTQPGRPAPGSLVRERQRSLVGASKPDVIVPIMPRATRPVASRPSPAPAAASLKPWERDAAEREAASKGGVVRSRVAAASPRDDEGGAEGFSGVGRLVSQWQTNAANGARGWGKVGEPRRLPPANPAEAKLSNEAAARVNGEENKALRRSSTMSQLASPRQPGRDV